MTVCGQLVYSADAATSRKHNVLLSQRSKKIHGLQLAVKIKKMFAQLMYAKESEVDFWQQETPLFRHVQDYPSSQRTNEKLFFIYIHFVFI